MFLLGEGAPPTAGGGITTISSGSLPAATTQSFTSIPATYAYLILSVVGASSDTATRHPMVVVSTTNGVSYDTTAASYTALSNGAAYTEASIFNTGAADQVAAATWTFEAHFYGYQGGSYCIIATSLFDSIGGSTAPAAGRYGASTSAIDALQIKWNGTGNFDAGTYALYGVR